MRVKTNGSVYVVVFLSVLVGAYFTHQWWLDPQRVIKRQLSNLAAALSALPDSRGGMDRLARIVGLRHYFAADVHVKTGPSGLELTSRDALLDAVAAWTASASGWNVDFVDVQITLDSDATARAYMTVEITTRDPRTGKPGVEAREAIFGMAEREGSWVITNAEPAETLQHP